MTFRVIAILCGGLDVSLEESIVIHGLSIID